jgi:RNA polymerase sigma-70 factor (ECF subfamily)
MTAFEAHRRSLTALAYRMLGSAAEAEDVVQEAWLRWQAEPREDVTSVHSYLATIVTRLCLDQLKSARARRESYVGPWLPEPVRTDEEQDRESISMAFLVLLERLSPVERAVYLLHEVFDYSHAEVGEIVGKEEAACRQLFHRAKQHIVADRPRFAPSREQHEQLMMRFLAATTAGDLDGLRALLAADATLWSDSGGKATAARRPIHGADPIARFLVGIARKPPPDGASVSFEIADINGAPALVLKLDSAVYSVFTIETDGAQVHGVRIVVNPDKLGRI